MKACYFTGYTSDEFPFAVIKEQPLIYLLKYNMHLRICRAIEDGFRVFKTGIEDGAESWWWEVMLRNSSACDGIDMSIEPCIDENKAISGCLLLVSVSNELNDGAACKLIKCAQRNNIEIERMHIPSAIDADWLECTIDSLRYDIDHSYASRDKISLQKSQGIDWLLLAKHYLGNEI